MLLNGSPLNEVPLNDGSGYALIPAGLLSNAVADASYVTGELHSDFSDMSYVTAQHLYLSESAADGSFVMQAVIALFAHILSADAGQVGLVPTDKAKTWANPAIPLALDAGGVVPHVRVTSADGLTVYQEGVDYVLEAV